MRFLTKTKVRRILIHILIKFPLRIKTLFYKLLLSDNTANLEHSTILQPTQFIGLGLITLKKANIGIWPSPGLFDRSAYIEARKETASIFIGENTKINNNCIIIAEATSIFIGKNCLIGPNFFATDSNFHGLSIKNRNNGTHECLPVNIGDDVFIGENVRILKGVTIGAGAVIGSGSVVTRNIAPNSVAAGVPAKLVSSIVQPSER